jgi:hypothetical protein
MNVPEQSEMTGAPPDAPADVSVDIDALTTSLRTAGADRFDPVRWHYIDVLAKRAASHQSSVRRMLDTRLAQALAEFKERFELAQASAREALASGVQRYPQATRELQQLFEAGDFKQMQRRIAALESRVQGASLRELVRQLEQHATEQADMRPDQNAGARTELKAVRKFRRTWAKLSVDKQVAQAFEQAPKNAGPINSHMLVLRSLALMREISPDYLNRFMSYTDTLLCLEQGEQEKPASPKKTQVSKTAKK